jgi:hypothetical protein
MTMNPEKKAAWLAALRGGTYRQGNQMLRYRGHGDREDRYCCLGVFCDIIEEGCWEHVDSTGYYDDQCDSVYRYCYGDDTRVGIIPEKLRRKYGISETQENNLINMNDDGYTFVEIAAHIEKHL